MRNHGRAGYLARRILTLILPACCAAAPSVGGIELGTGLHSRVRAKTLDALVTRSKPTFAWGDGDMLWVLSDGRDKPQFALNHAYQLDGSSKPGAWVLFDAARSYVPNGLVEFTREVTSGRVLAHDKRHGTVYLVSWNSREKTGTGIVGCTRQILLWRNRSDHWTLIGEAPPILRGQSGPRTFAAAITYDVRWTGQSSAPLAIHATRTETTQYAGEPGATSLHACREYLLEGKLPASFVHVGADFMPAAPGTKLADAIRRVAACKTFYPQERNAVRQKKMLTAISAAITGLNPHPIRGRVLLPDMDEIWDTAGRAAGPRGRLSTINVSEDR